MKRLGTLALVVIGALSMASCSQGGKMALKRIKYPYVQEYVSGQGNIKGDVPVEEYIAVSEDFAIGADKDGYAVFKDPERAFSKFMELYSDGLDLIEREYNIEPLTLDNCADYKKYGSQLTEGTDEQQAIFIGKFLDIYENSYVRR